MKHDELTTFEYRLYNYMDDHVAEHDNMPTTREIQKKFKIASTATVHGHIKELVEKGYLEFYRKGRYRFVRV